MSFWSRISKLITGGASSDDRSLPIYVLSKRCNEPIAGQVDLFNELSRTEDDDSGYFTRKVLHTSGDNRCFDQVEVNLWFDGNKRLKNHEVSGGRWLEADEYDAELARYNAPPDDTPVDEESV
jgi:hypothetical protein